MYLLDTNIVSELARVHPQPEVVLRFQATPEPHLFTSSICIEEIRFGCASTPNSAERWQRIWNLALCRLTVLGFDESTAIIAGDLRAEWKRRGTTVGYKDGLIAAAAKDRELILVTRNVRHFDHVSGLIVQNWFEPISPLTGSAH